jgi:TolB-like protein/Tfp pilus assembly protein PilF/predicted Ser/Thr protein kinase
MTPERWQQIDNLLGEALGRSASERAAFLDLACAGDEALRRKVEALLAAHERAESFIENPALEAATQALAEQARSLVGQQLGHYQVLALLGAGGMGEVYRAFDTRLDRTVALKLLPARVARDEKPLRRFIREAKAASALNHPNIATIYEIGEADGTHFISMEYVEGQTLAARINGQPLKTAEILEIATQIADALAEAHAKGITHRDIKPANVMLTSLGQVKMLDFGLAKIAQPDAQAVSRPSDTATATTQTGVVLGTVPYMSPEQALGREVDYRSDLYSLGVALYEMTTGRLPFAGATVSETLDRILHAQPEAVARFNYNAPAELERIVRKCLEKERERRYQSARDLAVDLRNLERDSSGGISVSGRAAPPPVSQTRRYVLLALAVLVLGSAGLALFAWRGQPKGEAIDSIAVLPFTGASVGTESEYLVDGITEGLINSLSQLTRLRVVARPTVFHYKGREIDPLKVGEELKVRAVLTGRLILRGETLSLQADLLDTNTGAQLWGKHYTSKLTDVLVVQDEIARHISEQLGFKLTDKEHQQLAKRYTENTEAYQLYLKGRFHWDKFTEDGTQKSIAYFTQALAKDPNYALAYVGLSDAYQLLGQIGHRPNEVTPKGLPYAEKALALDESLPEAHITRLGYYLFYGWDWVIVEREFKRIMELNPSYGPAYDLHGQYLSGMGQHNEAITSNKRALDFNPLSLNSNANLGLVYYYARQYDHTIEQCRKTFELDPNFTYSHLYTGWAYGQQGKYAEAIAELNKLRNMPGGFAAATSELGYVYAISGRRAEGQKLLKELQERATREFVDPYYIAIVYLGLGEQEQTFAWLNRAYEERSAWLPWLKVEPKFDRIRADARFADLVRRIGLSP